ncbi:pyridoxal-phosphate dependent enzyme [candidate division KSB1 bacterium]|nr:pyridoxal-phosphate dependent enzyme [candidate division KSB1 bacterium]
MSLQLPTFADVQAAAERIQPFAHRTPVLTSTSLNAQVHAQVFIKCENLQKVGAFKFRGACNTVFSLTAEQIQHGVATHSSGNHAAALALAARLRGSRAYIVMPRTAPQVKKTAVAGYRGEIIFCEPTLAAREATLAQVVSRTGATVVHPYNDARVIAGQGTAALELLQEVPDLDLVLTPVGGGGLLSGTALSVTQLAPTARVIAAEPAGADDAFRSLQAGRIIPSENPQTIADGLLTSLGELTFAIIQSRVSEIVTVSETAIIAAMRFVWERMKIIIEPSAAVPIGALFEAKIDFTDKRIGVIISGGNIDLDHLPWQSAN